MVNRITPFEHNHVSERKGSGILASPYTHMHREFSLLSSHFHSNLPLHLHLHLSLSLSLSQGTYAPPLPALSINGRLPLQLNGVRLDISDCEISDFERR